MWIGKHRLTISLTLAATIVLSSLTLAAQTKGSTETSDWSKVGTVAAGSKLAVKLKNGKTVAGKLTRVSDTALSLTVKEKPVDLERGDVLSIYQLMTKSAKKATLIGLAVGAGSGAAVGLAGSLSDRNGFERIDHTIAAGLTVLGAGAGALTGYLVGRSGSKRVLIYQASQP